VAVGGSTVYRTKRRFVEGNLERALSEEPRLGAERKPARKKPYGPQRDFVGTILLGACVLSVCFIEVLMCRLRGLNSPTECSIY
jgi:hypothetical protein